MNGSFNWRDWTNFQSASPDINVFPIEAHCNRPHDRQFSESDEVRLAPLPLSNQKLTKLAVYL
jgi:hypothetical protein